MKTIISFLFILFLSTNVEAHFTGASLQASGLTCSMCSKAVKNALEKVNFVEKVQVDIKNQQYNMTFKQNANVDFDALSKAVEDAGFSVANLKVNANVNNVKLTKDAHIKIDNKYFHFLNAGGKTLNGNTSFTIVDKQFVSAKDFKKHSTASKMECLKTGKAAKCCEAENIAAQTRIYHAVI